LRNRSSSTFGFTAVADLSFHKPADMVTCPVLYKPMARAAAGDRSMSLPRTQGPRSLMRTVTQPLWQTRIWVPNGSRRWAAVIAAQFRRSPLAVRRPQRPSDPPYMLATSACAVPSKKSSITAAMRPEQTTPFTQRPPGSPGRIEPRSLDRKKLRHKLDQRSSEVGQAKNWCRYSCDLSRATGRSAPIST
jgi:hypothetical protein